MATKDFARNRQDASVNPAALALPAAASTAVNTASIDLNAVAPFLADVELEISAPALDTTALPDTRTTTYSIQDSADDSTFATLQDGLLVQTGAGGAGAAAATVRTKLPSDVNRYIRATATTGVSTGDQSGSTFSLVMLF